MSPHRGEAGFSLVEMLVALVLLGLAALLMAQGFASGRRLWTDQERRVVAGEAVESAQSLVRDRIERLRPVTRMAGLAPYADLDGAPDRLEFLSIPPDAERPAPLRRYRLALSDHGDLVLGSAARASTDQAGEPYADQALVKGTQSLDIDYFGPARPGDAPGWQRDWTRRASPPQLVRIRVTFPAGDRRTWPELIVAPAASLDTLCAVDPATGGCRGRL